MFTLNGGQEQLLQLLEEWWASYQKGFRIGTHPQWFAYSGAAGTGKTTCIKAFIDKIELHPNEYMCCAFVGKAVLNLQQHGLPACTIHSLIYESIIETEVSDTEFMANGEPMSRKLFRHVLKEKLPDDLRLIVVDEATMVNNDMRDKILSFGIPTIFIGDMNQLPPIFGISEVMMYPNFELTQIMRQSEDDPIVVLSQMVLNEEDLDLGKYGISEVVEEYDITRATLQSFGMMICSKNKTRDRFTQMILREILHRKNREPFIGAKVINCQNDWAHEVKGVSLTNGLIGYVTGLSRGYSENYMFIDFQPDFMDDEFENLKLDRRYFLSDYETRKEYGISSYNKFEFAYWITVHKCQGSEAENVIYLDEPLWDREMTIKSRYTAITRARSKIVIIRQKHARKMRPKFNRLFNPRFT